MPTGYTAGILDGEIKTFEQFAKGCIRAFGAAMHMRDDSTKKEYVAPEQSNYYLNQLQQKNNDLVKIKLMSDDEIIQQQKDKIKEENEYLLNNLYKKQNNKVKMLEMLQQAKEYQPPTEEHEGIKKFMIEQLTITIDHDCDVEYNEGKLLKNEQKSLNIDPVKLRNDITNDLLERIEYYKQEQKKETERCEHSKKWAKDFFESLKTKQPC